MSYLTYYIICEYLNLDSFNWNFNWINKSENEKSWTAFDWHNQNAYLLSRIIYKHNDIRWRAFEVDRTPIYVVV